MKLQRALVPLVVAIFLASGVSVTSAPQGSSQHKVLFEKAKFTMETKGDLQGAIALFEEIIKKYPNEREYAAEALLNIGMCYEKLGLDKARDAYQRLIKDYPGQTAAVAAAQARLDNILRVTPAAKKGEGEITVRKVPTPPGQEVLGRVSPDGKYLVDVGGGTCNVWISDLVSGKQRYLTPADKDCSQGSPYGPHWSPDSTEVAFTWRSPSGAYDLRVVSLDGSAPRVLAPRKDQTWIEVLDWAPDGRNILAGVSYPDRLEMSLVDVGDGSARPIKTFTADLADGRFSPDGLYVAYSRAIGKGGNSPRTRDVFLVSVETGQEVPIVENLADDALLEWLPDGRGILFASDRAGTMDMWSIQIEKGQPKGAPSLVRRSIGPVTPLGLTKAGEFYYRTPSSFMDVYTASLDPKTGNVTGPLKKEPLPWEGHNRWSDWSPDGKRLAYVSARPTVVGPFQPGRAREFIVCVYSADTGAVREYRHEKVFLAPRWGPDGRHVYVTASNIDGRGIYRLDVESGAFTPFLFAGENLGMRYFQVSADGKWFVYNRNNIILRRDAGTGEEKELDRGSLSPAGFMLSRDGSRFAYVMRVDKSTKVLKAMQFPDGTPREILQLREKEGASEVGLSPDGRFIYYTDVAPEGGSTRHLWGVPAEGGTPQNLGLMVKDYIEQLTVHPDGLRLTFDAPTIDPERSQIWVMENFLPALQKVEGARR